MLGAALALMVAAAYAPVSAPLGRLFQRELDDARTDDADAGAAPLTEAAPR